MAENIDKQGPLATQSEGMTGNDGSKGNLSTGGDLKTINEVLPDDVSSNRTGGSTGGNEALENNADAGGSNANAGAGTEVEGTSANAATDDSSSGQDYKPGARAMD